MLKNVLLIVGSVAAALAAFEPLFWVRPDLRVAGVGPRFVFCTGVGLRYREDALFRKREIPESVYFEYNDEQWSLHLNNDRGFRDVFDSGAEHAIMLGDSFTRGTSLHNHQTIPHLLDLWTPDVAFHSFAIGGSGTADALRTYQAIAEDWDHPLVVLNYFLGNDLRDNIGANVQFDGNEARLSDVEVASAPMRTLIEAHRFLRANSEVYNLVAASAKILATGRRGSELSPDKFDAAVDNTKELLSLLGREAAKNDADLLIVIIPSWNEIMDLGAEDQPDRQRDLIAEVAAALNNVYVLDLSDRIKNIGSPAYGQVDKHFSPLGAYTAASSIYEWIQANWRNGPKTMPQTPPFDNDSWGITGPDCAAVNDYRDKLAWLASPTAEDATSR